MAPIIHHCHFVCYLIIIDLAVSESLLTLFVWFRGDDAVSFVLDLRTTLDLCLYC